MTKNASTPQKKIQVERRSKNQDRRQLQDRRGSSERRHDFRDGSSGQRKTIRVFLRAITNARLGVDRRKGDRRSQIDRRQPQLGAILTQDELNDLLSL